MYQPLTAQRAPTHANSNKDIEALYCSPLASNKAVREMELTGWV